MTLNKLFKLNKPLLNIYFSAGYPHLDSLPEILVALEESGVDMVEIGMPYSDPLSDGPTIQNSSSEAIKNGISTDLIFDQIAKSKTSIPKIMMGYFNAVLQYGIERFCIQCKEHDIKNLILPDLPIDVYEEQYKSVFDTYGIAMVFLVTPQTSVERIHYIDSLGSAFIYVVSSSSTTGGSKGLQSAEEYLKRIKSMNLKTPLMIGFNISSNRDFKLACTYASGAIIGSAFIRHITGSTNLSSDINQFVQQIKSNE